MEYDCEDSFPFNFEKNRISYGSKSKGKQSPRSYPIKVEKGTGVYFLSVINPFIRKNVRFAVRNLLSERLRLSA